MVYKRVSLPCGGRPRPPHQVSLISFVLPLLESIKLNLPKQHKPLLSKYNESASLSQYKATSQAGRLYGLSSAHRSAVVLMGTEASSTTLIVGVPVNVRSDAV